MLADMVNPPFATSYRYQQPIVSGQSTKPSIRKSTRHSSSAIIRDHYCATLIGSLSMLDLIDLTPTPVGIDFKFTTAYYRNPAPCDP
jgi:hypothetical protein